MASRLIIRKFSTTRPVREAFLSANYKSKKLWDQRYSCPMLSGDEEQIKLINNKIITGSDLSNLEVDIFINIAVPRVEDTAQLEESVKLLRKLRRSLYAHTQLPSTAHAVCRLFLDSQRLKSLVNLLDNRVEFGIFPDFHALNLLIDEANDKDMYYLSAKVASLVMLQEEFGINQITDRLALYSISRYIELKTDFSDWPNSDIAKDPILAAINETSTTDPVQEQAGEKKKAEEEEGDEDDEAEDDAEYIRVPFLKNPYSDNHFDLTNPRIICGKTFTSLAETFSQLDSPLSLKAHLFGSILQGDWSKSISILDKCLQSKVDLGKQSVDTAIFYVENLHNVEAPSDEGKAKILEALKKMVGESDVLSQILVKSYCTQPADLESSDIDQLKSNLPYWSEQRMSVQKREDERKARLELIQKIKEKKEELRLREQYLYYYDNLHKSHLKRVAYD